MTLTIPRLGVAEAIQKLGVRYAVITSVNRDELKDGGAREYGPTIDRCVSSAQKPL